MRATPVPSLGSGAQGDTPGPRQAQRSPPDLGKSGPQSVASPGNAFSQPRPLPLTSPPGLVPRTPPPPGLDPPWGLSDPVAVSGGLSPVPARSSASGNGRGREAWPCLVRQWHRTRCPPELEGLLN